MAEIKKELELLFNWLNSFSRPEQGCESLIEWLELEQKAYMAKIGRVVGRWIVFSSFTVIGLSCGAFYTLVERVPFGRTEPTLAGIFGGIGIALCGTGIGWLAGRRFVNRGRLSWLNGRDADAMRAIGRLRDVNGYRGLRKELGEHGVIELNEGANLYLRCRSILTSEAWGSQTPDDPWIEARDGMLRAMEAAMERLTVYVVRKRSFAEIAPVLEEMRTATTEAARITEQRSSLAGSAGRDLRASLARMKELVAAEDELLRLQDGL